MGKLDGKIAVITGGSTGIGLATARLLVREGARVVVTGRDQAALDRVVKEIGDGVEPFRSDISKMEDLEVLREHVGKHYGRVDVLYANAGGGRPGLFENVSEELVCSQVVGPVLREQIRHSNKLLKQGFWA